jgi:hypothetical protein
MSSKRIEMEGLSEKLIDAPGDFQTSKETLMDLFVAENINNKDAEGVRLSNNIL